MPLFQTSVLKNYLSQQDMVAIEQAYIRYSKYFLNQEIQQNIRNSKEEQFQATFLTELFVNVLDYRINPSPKHNLTTEFKNEKGAKKADGAILKEGKALGVVELKGTDTKDLDKVNGQAFSYKNNHSACVYVITSNFEKLRFFIQNAVEHIEFNLFTLTKEEFKVLWLCLHAENLLSGIPLNIKEESLLAEENITKQLYKDYSAFKTALWQNMVKNHPENDQLMLFKKTQKLLDRFLFIFFAEDSGLLPPNSVRKIIDKWKDDTDWGDDRKLYDIFKQYFEFINSGRPAKGDRAEIFGYNGGLFIEDPVLDNIKIDDDILLKYSEKLSTYDFQSEVDVNILGHIFENSLSEIENITAELEGQEIEKSKSKRKKDGVFYTPKYITKYIVDNTIGKLCEEKKDELKITDGRFGQASKRSRKGIADLHAYREWLLGLKICDPACGSGAFLNQALEFLIGEHRYLDELTAQYHKSTLVLSDIETHILEQNIYGVDINEESVEIAKLSLWLRTAQRGRKLTSLNNNIKCGNSLIDDSTIAGEKAFKWKKEFSKVFDKGGFDIIIGNPPYGAYFNESHKNYIIENYKSYQYKFESYLYFFEKGIEIMRIGGFLSYITPEMFLRLEKSKNIRQFLLNKSCLQELKFCGENVFEDVKVNSVVLTLRKGEENAKSFTIVPEAGPEWKYDFSEWKKEPLLRIEYEISPTIKHIIFKLENNSVRLGDVGEAIQGLTPYDSYRGHSRELIKNREFHVKEKVDESCGKWLDGKHVNRYSLSEGGEWLKYGDWLAAQREKRFFEGARLLYREVPGQNKRIQATYAEETYYHGHSITPFILENRSSKEELFPILGVTNSKLISWYIKYKSSNFSKNTFPKLNPKDIKGLPIPRNYKNDLELGSKAKLLLQRNAELNELSSKFLMFLQSKLEIEKFSRKLQTWHDLELRDFLKELKKAKVQLSLSQEAEWMQYFNEQKQKAQLLKSDINRVDAEIDQMVYQLYGLTEDEIKIVKGET